MASAYLSQTFSTYDSTKIFTLSTWLKKSSNGVNNAIYGKDGATDSASQFYFDTSDQLRFFDSTSSSDCDVKTNRVFRDNSAFYHIVISVDTTQATASNRVKIYINGTQETSLATSTYPAQDSTLKSLDSAKDTFVGVTENTSGTKFGQFDGIMTHFHFIDGTAYDADTFGEQDTLTGIWKAKTAPSVTYGTNGFFLKFENSSSMGTDSSGNANNFTVNGTLTQTEDTPSNVFATLNGLIRNATGSTLTLSNGNTKGYSASTSYFAGFSSTLGVSSGKYYWEYKLVSTTAGSFYTGIGVTSENYINYVASASRGDPMAGGTSSSKAESYEYLVYNGKKQNNGTATAHGDTMTTGDIAMVALDLDNNYIYFGKNGTWQNSSDPTSGSSGTGAAFSLTTGLSYFPIVDQYYDNTTAINFGNGYFGTTAVSSAENPDDGIGIFEYDVPTGYRALCTKSINAEEYS